MVKEKTFRMGQTFKLETGGTKFLYLLAKVDTRGTMDSDNYEGLWVLVNLTDGNRRGNRRRKPVWVKAHNMSDTTIISHQDFSDKVAGGNHGFVPVEIKITSRVTKE